MQNQLNHRILKNESGSAIAQVFMVAIFIAVLSYLLADWSGKKDSEARRMIERTVYHQLGEAVSDDVQDPELSIRSQEVRNDLTYD